MFQGIPRFSSAKCADLEITAGRMPEPISTVILGFYVFIDFK